MTTAELADELESIRSGVDVFNPDARMAARSAFNAAERVWKMVPEIIEALRAQRTTPMTSIKTEDVEARLVARLLKHSEVMRDIDTLVHLSLREAADTIKRLRKENASALEQFEGFAITMFRAFLCGLESNKAHRWDRESSDVAERNFKAALQDYRAALTPEEKQ